MSPRVLVAGIGNVFFRDDGFGVAVARYLTVRALPAHVVVRDVGIRGLHLAYDLVEDWGLLVVVDAVSITSRPGTLHLIQPGDDLGFAARTQDAHGMGLESILQTASSLGATLPDVLVVGCDVADISEGVGLTPEVDEAVPQAAQMVESILEARAHGTTPFGSGPVLSTNVPTTKETRP
ncbi:MAG TPA: hydrogenase maturation protease [Polyangiaceae bacterium]|jgi:hydrogenase maturation protease